MIRLGNDWYSEFPDADGNRRRIDRDEGQATIASFRSLTGGHAMLYTEYLDTRGNAITRKIHLLAGLGGSAGAESTGSGSSATGGTNEIEIQEEAKSFNEESDVRAGSFYYTGYPMTSGEREALNAAVRRFKVKVANGRYTYRLAGGVIGRLTTRPSMRGVNCADFLIKVMAEAGIATISSRFFNSPSRIAGH